LHRNETKHDARAAWVARLSGAPTTVTIPLAYPRLLALHQLLPDAAARAAEGLPLPTLAALPLSSEKLDPEGVFLMENGWHAYIYFGKAAPAGIVRELLGASASPCATTENP
jgi:protein transport protein SEC24